MEFQLDKYKSYLNDFMHRKYDFIDSIEVVSLRIRLGVLHGEFRVITKEGTIKDMTPQCREKINKGDKISFWTTAICFRKKFNLTQIEKDMELIFWEILGQPKRTIGAIKTEYIIN